MNQFATDFVKQHEGCKLIAYQDQGGTWTIGYGHTGPDVYSGVVWTQAQADNALQSDLNKAETAVRVMVDVAVGPQSIGALMSFVFNLGPAALRGSTALMLINKGDHLGGAKALVAWDHIGAVENKGLLIRRLGEALLYLQGV